MADIFYYQVDNYIDYHEYVLGSQPAFDETVSYPYEWRGGPVKKLRLTLRWPMVL